MEEFYRIFMHNNDVSRHSHLLSRIIHDSAYRTRELDPGDDAHTPNVFFGIWRGGSSVAATVTGNLIGYGVALHHFPATGKSYRPKKRKHERRIRVYNMQELMEVFRDKGYKAVFGVDDVHDTGRTWHAFHHIMRNGLFRDSAVDTDKKGGHTMYLFRMHAGNEDDDRRDEYILEVPLTGDIEPLEPYVVLKLATLHWKPDENKTEHCPDYCVRVYRRDGRGRRPWIIYPWEANEELTIEELSSFYPEIYEVLYGTDQITAV